MKSIFSNKRARIIYLGLFLFLVITCTVQAKEKKEILIGAPIPVTGILSMIGLEQKWAYEQAFAECNKQGGIYVKEYGKKLPVKLIVEDAESDPGKAVAAVERLIKIDKVDLLLSSQTSNLVIPTCIAAEKLKTFYHTTTCLDVIWLPNKFKWSTLFFTDLDHFSTHTYEILNSINESERPKRLALVMEDTDDGRALGGVFRTGAEKMGYKFVVDESWMVGAKDYSSQILKLKTKKIDGVILFGTPSDCVTFVRQSKESKFSPKFLHGFKGTWGTEFWNALGKDAQYVLADGFWSEDFPFPKSKELGTNYFKTFQKQSVSIGMFYALCQTLFSAIEIAGTLDGAKIRKAVLANEFKNTAMGNIKYNPDGVAHLKITASQWWNGKLKLVYPAVEGGWRTKLAPPWGQR